MNFIPKTIRLVVLICIGALCAQAEDFSIQLGDVVSPGVPGPGAGSIESIASSDTYTFHANAGQLIFAETISVAAAFGGYLMWEVKAPSGASVFRAYFDAGDEGRRTLPETGTYSIRFWVTGTVATRIGDYSFALRAIAPDQTFAIQIGDTVSNGVPGAGAGNIETAGAQDFYTFQATAGQLAFFEQVSAAASFAGNLQLELNGPGGNMVFRSYFSGTPEGRRLLAETGTYTLRVYSPLQDAAQAGTYSFRVRAIPPDPVFPIAIGDTVSNGVPGPGAGNIEVPGAEDRYTFQGTAGQNVFFEQLGAATAFEGYLMWEILQPSGTTLTRAYIGGSGTIGRKTLPETGAYTIRVYVNSTKVSRLGTYSFRTYAIGDSTFPITVGTEVSNGVPAPGAGKLEVAGEQDLFTFPGTAGQKVIFEPINADAAFDGHLFWEVKAPSGTLVVRDYLDKGREHAEVLPESGTYQVKVYVIVTAADRIGVYSFRLYSPVFANPDQFVTSPGKALVIPIQKFLCNDTWEQGDILTVTVPSLVSQAGMTLATNSTQIMYMPTSGFSGTDKFTYRLAGAFGDADIGEVTVVVAAGAGDHPSVVSFKRTVLSQVQVCLFGDPNKTYNVETSADLVTWQPGGAITSDAEGSIQYQFTIGTEAGRYYRFR